MRTELKEDAVRWNHAICVALVAVAFVGNSQGALADSHRKISVNPERLRQVSPFVPTKIGGWIESIREDGAFVMQDGAVIWQWALKIEPNATLEQFMVGRLMNCVRIFERGDGRVGDCIVRGLEPKARGKWLDLYIWLPELGWAVRACDPEEYPLNDRGGRSSYRPTSEVGYSCRKSDDPRRHNTIIE